MGRRTFLGTLAGGLLAAPLAAEAQHTGEVYQIGVLSGASAEWLVPMLAAFRRGLLDLGYAESEIVFHVRYAEGRDEILPRLVGELISLKVDVIVTTSSTPGTLVAKQATAEIPIVMVGVGQPEAVVSNIARPGGNITGSTILGTEVASKRLELVKELRPGATQVALLWNPDNPANVYMQRELQGTSARHHRLRYRVRRDHEAASRRPHRDR
jgi:putative ABC transport system substrate-binding protein